MQHSYKQTQNNFIKTQNDYRELQQRQKRKRKNKTQSDTRQ